MMERLKSLTGRAWVTLTARNKHTCERANHNPTSSYTGHAYITCVFPCMCAFAANKKVWRSSTVKFFEVPWKYLNKWCIRWIHTVRNVLHCYHSLRKSLKLFQMTQKLPNTTTFLFTKRWCMEGYFQHRIKKGNCNWVEMSLYLNFDFCFLTILWKKSQNCKILSQNCVGKQIWDKMS